MVFGISYIKIISLNIIIIFLVLGGCAKKNSSASVYPEKSGITNKAGIPANSNVSYFPKTVLTDKSFFKVPYDSNRDHEFPCVLYNFKEPILYNYFQNKEIIRLLWQRAFNGPVMIKLVKDKGEVYITTKMFNRSPNIPKLKSIIYFYSPPLKKGQRHKKQKVIKYEGVPSLPELVMVINKTRKLSVTEWNTMLKKLDEIDYYHIRPFNESGGGIDGSDWLLETHLSGGYYYVKRWAPHDKFQKCCEYLIHLSDAKNERIY
jgi:hypothetical protein